MTERTQRKNILDLAVLSEGDCLYDGYLANSYFSDGSHGTIRIWRFQRLELKGRLSDRFKVHLESGKSFFGAQEPTIPADPHFSPIPKEGDFLIVEKDGEFDHYDIELLSENQSTVILQTQDAFGKHLDIALSRIGIPPENIEGVKSDILGSLAEEKHQ